MSGSAVNLAADLRQRAAEHHQAGRLSEALPLYAAYLGLAPRDSSIWSNLGSLFRSENRHDLALKAHERAYALAPENNSVLNNLANVLSDIGQYDRALHLRHQILKKTPGDAAQKAMIGKALRGKGDYAASIAYLEPAIADHPTYYELQIQLALSQLAARRYVEGFTTYDVRWKTGELTARKISQPKWNGESLAGRTILVLPEQGFGDAITFARFIPVLRRFDPKRVMLLCEKPLLRLMAEIEGVDWIGPEAAIDSGFDVWTNMMDLPPHAFAADPAVPPPTRLCIPEDSRQRARAIVGPHAGRFKVGVVWCGSVTYRGNAFRSFSHTEFHPLLDLPDVQFFSLYKGPELAPYHADGTSAFILDTASSDRDFADCAATMEAMDLIITSDTATAHVAGSLGRPVWTLLHWDAFWLWQHQGDRTPWYPTMELFRQSSPRDWSELFVRVKSRLEPEVAAWRKAKS
jgi:Tfp pilus assembly protein PilF